MDRLRSVLSGSGKPVARLVPGEQTMLTLESFGIPVLLKQENVSEQGI
jgi:antitoxin (DNA-binding transcriptional repressor) of toxin-antitoxin stability system